MLFFAAPFLVFFAFFFPALLFCPFRYRTAFLILSSCVFYGYWNPYYAVTPLVLIAVAYFFGLWLEKESSRKLKLALACSVLLLPLLFFKYTNFFVGNAILLAKWTSGGRWLASESPVLSLPLPLGISFVTFTLISYVVDIYRRKVPVEHRLGLLAGSVLYFPHLIAGPIVRPYQLIHQLEEPKKIRMKSVVLGLLIFSVGLFKKLVLADQLAAVVDKIYIGHGPLSMMESWMAIYGFTFQIYCDFSAYSDMALGLAHMMRMKLPQNFDQPYLATSLVDFWRRWHITLSSWLRDYLYIPLGGSRCDFSRQLVNIMITMALGGLWHGASWTFVIWGIIHGALISLNHIWRRSVDLKMPAWMGRIITFHVVAIAWVFFRAKDMPSVGRVLSGAISFVGSVDLSAYAFFFAVLLVAAITHVWDSHRYFKYLARKLPKAILWPGIAFLWGLAYTISSGAAAEFIYFEF